MVLHDTIPDDEQIDTMLPGGDVSLYRACAAHLTADASLLDAEHAEVESKLAAAMRTMRDSNADAPPALSSSLKRRIMRSLVDDVEISMGKSYKRIDEQPGVEDDLVDIFDEEVDEANRGWRGLSSTPQQRRADAMDDATKRVANAAKGRPGFKVAIIGAGASGLCAAIKLRQAGVEVVVLERNSRVGGVWSQNEYPEAGCDVPSHYYSFSFAPKHNWTKYYSKAGEIQQYCEDVAKHYAVLDAIRFGTKVIGASFDEDTGKWVLAYEDVVDAEQKGSSTAYTPAGAAVHTLVADALISAVGQLSEPNIPPIPGKDDFRGPSAHTAQWRKVAGADGISGVRGKHVAVVGTGASAMQLLRGVAQEAKHVTVFQQIPGWFLPRPNYHQQVDKGMQWRLAHVPLFQTYYRFRLHWQGADGLHDALFPGPENDSLRTLCEYTIRKAVGDDKELLAKVLPSYPPFCTRVLVDNEWIKTLKRDNVTLVPHQVDQILPDALEAGGQRYGGVDCVVYSTGFKAQSFLTPMAITGRGGRDIREVWDAQGGASAMLGITVPDFPNFFICYGPSTNLAHGGSIIFHSECQVRYIMDALGALLENGQGALLECRKEALDTFNAELADTIGRTVFQADCGVRYKDANGNVTGNSPWRLLDYFRRTRRIDPAHYSFSSVAGARARL